MPMSCLPSKCFGPAAITLIYVGAGPYLKSPYGTYEIIDICSGSGLQMVKKWPLADKEKQFLLFYSGVVNLMIMDIFPWGNKC